MKFFLSMILAQMVMKISHRGYIDSKFTMENSHRSITNAINNDFDVIELDVQLTKDNIIILHHDLYINTLKSDVLKKSDDLNYKLSMTDNVVKTFNFQLFFKSLLRPLNILKKKNENIRVNWNNTEYLSPVKNQGQCGSCYAFSTTNVLETFMRINNYNVDRLSEQQIVDCSPNDYGCEGGFMHTSLDFIINNKGLIQT